MARIRKHRNKWQVLYRDPATKRERFAGVFTRKPDAVGKRWLVEREIEFGDYIDPDLQNTTAREWVNRWMATHTRWQNEHGPERWKEGELHGED